MRKVKVFNDSSHNGIVIQINRWIEDESAVPISISVALVHDFYHAFVLYEV